jgi:Cof subfamily protein (haloacid dehalogenase superfamily)
MPYKLIAFDLDGTLLTRDKRLSDANRLAIADMQRCGMRVAFASGRLGSSMMPYAAGFEATVSMLTLNGAVTYSGLVGSSEVVYQASLPPAYADELTAFAHNQDFGINYYIDDKLYSVKTDAGTVWNELYFRQTGTQFNYLDDLGVFRGRSPSKLIFVGAVERLDGLEAYFRSRWDSAIYICRTWKYYLEFMNVNVDKGKGLAALARFFGHTPSEVVAFGDALNDIPMLSGFGLGIAMANADEPVKKAAGRVSPWSHEEDGVAREWERIRGECCR